MTAYPQAIESPDRGAVKKESSPEKPTEQAERMRKILEGLGNNKSDTPILPDSSSLEILDDQTRERFFMAMREYYDYRTSGYKHRTKVFEWQLASSRVIFVVVIFLVLTGVYFSWVQFRTALREKHPPESAKEATLGGEDPPAKPDVTEFVASLKGVRVSSPVLGVIILVISLVFFYLYLVYVYPVHEVL